MPVPSPEAERLADLYRLNLDLPRSQGAPGERLGRREGSSLEFQDRRAYTPGDDVRHLDWRTYARTDQLLIRLYREEILAHLDLFVDASKSMDTCPLKAQLAMDMSWLLARCAARSGFSVSFVALGDVALRLDFDLVQREGVDLSGASPLPQVLESPGRPGSLRLLVSDFLFPHDPTHLIRKVAQGAAKVVLIQLLSEEDREPKVGSTARLQDAETSQTLDLVLDETVVERYRQRLSRLGRELEDACRRVGASFFSFTTNHSLESLCRDELAAKGFLQP